MRRFERYFPVVVILVTVFASLSCSLGAGGTVQRPTDTIQPAAPQTTTIMPTPTVPPVATNVPTQPEVRATRSAPAVGDISSNSAAFDSYSMTLAYHGEGIDDKGNPIKQDFTFAEDSIKSQKADHFRISGMSALVGVASGDLDIYQLDTSLYMYSAAQNGQVASCLALGGDKSTFDPNTLNPAALLKNITVDQLVAKGEVVNGVLADHYTVKNADMGFGKATFQSGDVWLAQGGGYAVRFTGRAEGSFNLVSAFTGTVTWSYDLTQINQVASIDLPPECASQQNVPSDLVLPPNATDISQLGQMTVFTSPDKPADVSAFLQNSLPGKGWTINSVDESQASVITIQISKAIQKLQITISEDSTTHGSSVVIMPAQ